MACFRREAGGLALAVRLTPKASRDAIEGIGRLSDGREVLLARVRAVPAESKANTALVILLAGAFRVPKSAVTIVGGAQSRLKEVRVEGDPSALEEVVRQWPVAS